MFQSLLSFVLNLTVSAISLDSIGLDRSLEMTKEKRDIGREILEGIREIKSGRYGQVVTISEHDGHREKTNDDGGECAPKSKQQSTNKVEQG